MISWVIVAHAYKHVLRQCI